MTEKLRAFLRAVDSHVHMHELCIESATLGRQHDLVVWQVCVRYPDGSIETVERTYDGGLLDPYCECCVAFDIAERLLAHARRIGKLAP